MKYSLCVALALLCSVAAADTMPPPAIVSIVPSSGSVSGGTPVAITGANLDLPPDIVCILPCPTTVLFGNIEVVPSKTTSTRIDVSTPVHGAGAVDVTVKTGDGRRATAPGAFTYTPEAQVGYETILLPIYIEGVVAGANGSRWQSDFWLRNNGESDIVLAPWACPADTACATSFPLTYALTPGETLHNLPALFTVPSPNPARLLYATRDNAGRLSGNLRIFDTSRAAINAGTEVPLVRESDLQSTAIHLHNVPLDAHFRVMLRIYDVALAESRFLVNFYPEDAGTSQPAISSVELTATGADPGSFRLRPAWAQYGALPDLLNQPTIQPVQLRAEVVPLTAGARFWAFISLTNNDTQHVTLITPQ